MSTFINAVRWLLFLPVGFAAGLFTAALFINLLGVVFGGWWLTGCLTLVAGSALQPIVGYHLGLAIAPTTGKASRLVMKSPYAVLCLSAGMMIATLLFGETPDCHKSFVFTGVSDWWYQLSSCLGLGWGGGAILDHTTPATAARHPATPEPVAATSPWDRFLPN